MKQSQGLRLLLYETLRERFSLRGFSTRRCANANVRNDCKYFCPSTYQGEHLSFAKESLKESEKQQLQFGDV
ncbi:MAG: hypothetical protein V7K48_25635 [Nostoc sp.]|uniref:hypothetical protein n=1 Tax=Nostoc sp. TaxID=1180 RepID=UPI002FF53FCE